MKCLAACVRFVLLGAVTATTLCAGAAPRDAILAGQPPTVAGDEHRLARADQALAAGRHREALENYDAILERAPTRLDVRAKRAIALSGLGDLDAARKEIRAIKLRTVDGLENELLLRPDDALLLGRAARLRSELRDDQAALTHGRRLAELQPTSAEAHFTLGNVLYRAGEVRAAQDSYDRALSIDPRKTEAYVARAAAREHLGDHTGAAADLLRAREILP